MSDTAPEEKKTAPDGIARSLEEKERKNSGERPETKGDEPADNTRQRALSQCIEYLEDGESEYSHPADMAEHLENLSLKDTKSYDKKTKRASKTGVSARTASYPGPYPAPPRTVGKKRAS